VTISDEERSRPKLFDHLIDFLSRKYYKGEPQMSISSIINFFEALGAKAYTDLCSIFGKTAIDAVDAEIKTILQADVRVIFQDAITAAESLQIDGTAASGAQKQSAAFAQITTDLKTQGKSFTSSMVNFGIELVLGLIRGQAAKV
jgi:hypothetical protein